MTPSEYYYKYLELEAKTFFFNVKIEDINIWNNMRYFLFYYLGNKLSLIPFSSMSEEMIKYRRKSLVSLLGKFIKHRNLRFIKQNIALFFEQKDLLCILFPVRKRIDHKDVEVYADYYYEDIKDFSYYALEWSPGISYKAEKPMTKNLRYISEEVILTLFTKKTKYSYRKIYLEFYNQIVSKIEKEFEIIFTKQELNIINRELYLHYSKRDAYIRYYKFILKQIKPKAVLYYNIAEYYTQLLIETAKEYNIKTIEIQHGTFSKRSMIPYTYIPNIRVSTVPDYLLTYSKCFNDFIEIKRSIPVVIGRPDMLNSAIKYGKRNKKQICEKKNILIISSIDGTIERCKELLDSIDYNKYEVSIKFHPSELHVWKINYPFLLKYKKVNLITNTKKEIYYWISRADYIIGKLSTVFYEAIFFPAKKILLDYDVDTFGGIAIKKGYFAYADEKQYIKDVIEQIECGKIKIKDCEKDDYLVYKGGKMELNKALKKIVVK